MVWIMHKRLVAMQKSGKWSLFMRLRTKFVLLIGLVIVVSYGITFYRTSAFQHELVLTQVVNQARMLHKQVLMTRKWVAEHNGLFFLAREDVKPNPFLKEPEIEDTAGRRYVKRNPAMVTRELSEYVAREGFFKYRVTTLKAINPANEPDDFERRGLHLFEEGVPEIIEIESTGEGKNLRYMTPLYVEESCLECHAHQGYKEGDIRGGLSVTIPVDWAYQGIRKNNRMLFLYGIITIFLVGITIFLLIDFLVVRRLGVLARAMDRFPGESDLKVSLPAGIDEIGRLSTNFKKLCSRLKMSQLELDQSREQVFQSEKLAALGRLAAGVAHEVNNPLGGMLNCVKSMQESPDDQNMRERYLELLGKGLMRIGHVVNQLLNFGRQEPALLRKISVDSLIQECLVLLQYGLKNIDLRTDFNAHNEYSLDVESLKQVVVNVCLNAIQAMPDGGTLKVETREVGSSILLKIEDTGIGIEKEDLQKIFEPFFTTKDIGEGTGLGLFVTYSLVQRMNGSIVVESEKDRGTCFRIELPVGKKGRGV